MRTNAPKELFNENSFVRLKNKDWLEKQRVAGRIAAETLLLLEGHVRDRTFHSFLGLNDVAELYIIKNGGTPTFKGYKGFPAGVCISLNKQLVHGIPVDHVMSDGDIVSFDLGVTYKGAIADTALTCIFGKPHSEKHTKLVQDTEAALMRGINAIKVGERLGVIGQAIYKKAHAQGYGVINHYGGHGLSWDKPHDAPFVSNKASENEGIRIQPGLTIAIEPMLVLGGTQTYIDKDGWTVWGMGISAHYEHTVFVHEDHVEIITDRTKL